jgi:uncharacterized protein with HEPN domain
MNRCAKNVEIIKHIVWYCDAAIVARERFGVTIQALADDFDYQSCCAMYVLQIGELSTRLSADFKDEYIDIPWNKIKAMRNIFAHDYDKTRIDELWETITDDIPVLRVNCLRILSDFNEEYDPDDFEPLHSDDDEQLEL